MKGELDKAKRPIKKVNKIPDKYKVLDIIIKGRNIVLNIEEIVQLANTNNKAEVISSMNKACSYYHSFARLESELQGLVIQEEENFELWKAQKKKKYIGDKDYSSESAKERGVLLDFPVEYQKRSKKIADFKNFEKQCSIARNTLSKHVDMIKSIGAIVREQKSDPLPTSESDNL